MVVTPALVLVTTLLTQARRPDCLPEEAARFHTVFFRPIATRTRWTYQGFLASIEPDDTWVDAVASRGSACAKQRMRAIEIGANSGFDCAGWARVLSHDLELASAINSTSWKQAMTSAAGVPPPHRATSDRPLATSPLSAEPALVDCLEIVPALATALTRAASQEPFKSGGMHVHNIGIEKEDGWLPVRFHKRWNIFDQGASIQIGPDTSGGTTVRTLSVDSFVFGRAGEPIAKPFVPTVLTVDTEGHDARVLLGAKRTLGSGEVAYLQFEFHQLPPWPDTPLRSVIDMLDGFGFDCWFAGSGGMTPSPLTPRSCWTDHYGKHEWSNIVCAHRAQACWHGALMQAEQGAFRNASLLGAKAHTTYHPRRTGHRPFDLS